MLIIFLPLGALTADSQDTTRTSSNSAAPVKSAAGKREITLPPEKTRPVRIAHFDKAPVIDGRLDDEVWKQATVLKDFYQIQPGDNIAPSKPAEVLLGYDSKTLFIAFRAPDEAGKVRLSSAEEIRSSHRSRVSRYIVLEGPPGAPQSVIVKQAIAVGREVYDPDRPDGPAWRLFNEWAGLQFLTETCGDASPAPQFYAGDRDRGFLVLEDLGTCIRLDQVLLGDDPRAAEAMLVAFAATLGRMHALTLGKQSRFDRIRGSLGPRAQPQQGGSGNRLATMLREMAQIAGVEPALGIDEELSSAARNLAEPGPFHAYLHRDPCPDNCLMTDEGVKLIDHEFGGYGHALQDGIYGRIHFPSCWCVNRLPEQLPLRMEAAYRAELSKGCHEAPEIMDDAQFYRAMVETCAACLIISHHAQSLLRDDRWGISTMRQRALLRFDIFWKLTEEHDHLKAVGATVRTMAEKLRAQWPAEAGAMPYYPAFRGRSHDASYRPAGEADQ